MSRTWLRGRRARRVRSLAGGVLAIAFAATLVASTSAAQASQARPQSPACSAQSAQSAQPLYLDTRYSFAERAADLVSCMTLAEKVQQLQTNNAPAIPRLGVQQYTYWSEGQHGINRLGADTTDGGQGDRRACTRPASR